MRFFSRLFLGIMLACSFGLAQPSLGETTPVSDVSETSKPVFLNIPDKTTQPTLDNLKTRLRRNNQVLQNPSRMWDRSALQALMIEAQELIDQSSDLITTLKPRLAGYEQALKLIGDVPEKSTTTPQNADLALQHKNLIKFRDNTLAQIQQASLIQLEARGQIMQIQENLSQIQQTQLFSWVPSPLSYDFWHEFIVNSPSDSTRINAVYRDFWNLFSLTWNDSLLSKFLMILGFVGAGVMIFILRPLLEKIITKLVEKFIPPTRLRRSLMTLIAAILSSFTAGISATIVISSLSSEDIAGHSALTFAHTIINQLYFCGFILGLYRGFLAVRNPQWRLLPIGDETAKAISILPILYACLVFILGILKYINNASGVSLIAQQFCNGFFTLMMCFLFLTIPLKLKTIWKKKLENVIGNGPGLKFLVLAVALPIFFMTCIVTILLGYIPLGFSMCVWLNWTLLVISTLGLLGMIATDITHLVLDPDRWLGLKVQVLGIKAQRMDQLSTIITGIVSVLTLLLVIISVMSPGNFDFSMFLHNIYKAFMSQKIGGFTLSFYLIGEAIFVIIISLYCIRAVRNWLLNRFFPKTSLDNASRNSIVTIFNYFCWVLVAIIVLSILGVTTQNITWIVSALSVGIGFGLQAIVQNFVSGLILLTERPVRIGDTVTVGGVKGTVLSIKVRATEIQLSDLSTLIVPNSQLITSSVQNATRSRHLGLLSLTLPVITVYQLEASRKVILGILEAHKEVVDNPKPIVLVDSITETSLIISLKAYVGYSSNVDMVRSEILAQYLSEITRWGLNRPGQQLDAPIEIEKKSDDKTAKSE